MESQPEMKSVTHVVSPLGLRGFGFWVLLGLGVRFLLGLGEFRVKVPFS